MAMLRRTPARFSAHEAVVGLAPRALPTATSDSLRGYVLVRTQAEHFALDWCEVEKRSNSNQVCQSSDALVWLAAVETDIHRGALGGPRRRQDDAGRVRAVVRRPRSATALPFVGGVAAPVGGSPRASAPGRRPVARDGAHRASGRATDARAARRRAAKTAAALGPAAPIAGPTKRRPLHLGVGLLLPLPVRASPVQLIARGWNGLSAELNLEVFGDKVDRCIVYGVVSAIVITCQYIAFVNL